MSPDEDLFMTSTLNGSYNTGNFCGLIWHQRHSESGNICHMKFREHEKVWTMWLMAGYLHCFVSWQTLLSWQFHENPSIIFFPVISLTYTHSTHNFFFLHPDCDTKHPQNHPIRFLLFYFGPIPISTINMSMHFFCSVANKYESSNTIRQWNIKKKTVSRW